MKELTMEITDRCSLNCVQCSTRAGPDGDTFFSVEDVARYLGQFRDFDVVRVSGGEPFEHPELDRIVKFIEGQGKQVQIMSCGVKERRPIPLEDMRAIAPYVDEVVWSMHGLDPKHDQIVTGDKQYMWYPPYWDHLCDSFDHANLAGIRSSFQTVVMKDNFDDLTDIAWAMRVFREGTGKPYHWHILRFVKQGRGQDNAAQALDPQQAYELPSRVRALARANGLQITYTNSFDECNCESGTMKAVVTCKRKVIPCSALKYDEKTDGRFACKYRL